MYPAIRVNYDILEETIDVVQRDTAPTNTSILCPGAGFPVAVVRRPVSGTYSSRSQAITSVTENSAIANKFANSFLLAFSRLAILVHRGTNPFSAPASNADR
jgi:uncharacterized protein YejL (UPF0352 family)